MIQSKLCAACRPPTSGSGLLGTCDWARDTSGATLSAGLDTADGGGYELVVVGRGTPFEPAWAKARHAAVVRPDGTKAAGSGSNVT